MKLRIPRTVYLFFLPFLGVAAIVAFIGVKTAMLEDRQLEPSRTKPVNLDVPEGVVGHLRAAVRHKTVVTVGEECLSDCEFTNLHKDMKGWFTKVYQTLDPKAPEGNLNSLYFRWEGSQPGLKPVILTSHLDVVPAEAKDWHGHDPFGGDDDGEFIWGRGTLDDKLGVLGILEAAEWLLREGYRPKRTIYFAFGATEEVGSDGAPSLVKAIKAAEKIRPGRTATTEDRDLIECVVDEGTAVVRGLVPGAPGAIAPIGVVEKGYVDIILTVKQTGGHSSVAPPRTAIGILSRAVDRLDRSPFASQINSVTRETLETLAPELTLPIRAALANLWLLGTPVRYALAAEPELNAMIRTTGASTIVGGGTKDNVLPEKVTATINYRILPDDLALVPLPGDPAVKPLPGEDPAETRARRDVEIIDRLKQHVVDIVADPNVNVEVDHDNRYAPSEQSPTRTDSYRALQQGITDVFHDEKVIVVPFLVTAGTDARFYEAICKNVYRFLPITLESSDLARIHGVDERIKVEGYRKVVAFYRHLIEGLGEEFQAKGPAASP